ncbi:DUF3467 domain-containing protein [Pseudodesulfovibrio sp.]|uniref:DUF3467 domain-containing protein n=1 Tax=Pseudodesulfovibrio sp. TaxID=2035812 RepID=UPI002603A572|nr:DUF3467 domain-containing protein [Pseudodesulfovibrio sp.]MDD3311114.1 DUF3467 domain-containing protein [Pseudodesulfovibrio sp.]
MSQENENQQIRLNVNADKMNTVYANAFQTHSTPEELLLSFGINQTLPSQEEGVAADMILQFTDRIIMNHYTAKRLTLSLLQSVREHEERFGVIELDVSKRLHQTAGTDDGGKSHQ